MKKNNFVLLGAFFISTFFGVALAEAAKNAFVPITLVHSKMHIPRSFHSNKGYAVITKDKGTFVFVSPTALDGKVFSTNDVKLTTNDLYLIPSKMLELSEKDENILEKKQGFTRKLTQEEMSRLEKYQFVIAAEKNMKNDKNVSAVDVNNLYRDDQSKPQYQNVLFLYDSGGPVETLLCLATAPICFILEVIAAFLGAGTC